MPKKAPWCGIKAKRIERRPNATARGYTDRKHREWRLAVLNRDAWQCRACGRVCCIEKGEAHADHVSPVVQGTTRCENGASRYDVLNGQCLCAACHAAKGRAERGER